MQVPAKKAHAFAAALLSLLVLQKSGCDGGPHSRRVPTHCDPLPAELTTPAVVNGPDTVEEVKCNSNFSGVPPAPVDSGFGVNIKQGFVTVSAVLAYVDGTRKQCEAKIDGRGTGVGKEETVCLPGATRFEDQDGVWKCRRPGAPDVRTMTTRPREQCLRDIRIEIRSVVNILEGDDTVLKPRPEDPNSVNSDLLRVQGPFVGLAESVSGSGDVSITIPESQSPPVGDPCTPPNCLLLKVTTGKQTPEQREPFTLTSPGGFNTATSSFRVTMRPAPEEGRAVPGSQGGTGSGGHLITGGISTPTLTPTPTPVPTPVVTRRGYSGIDCGCPSSGDYVDPRPLAESAAGVTVTDRTKPDGTHSLLVEKPGCIFSYDTHSAEATWGFSPHGKFFVTAENTQNLYGNNLRVWVYNLSTCQPFSPYDSSVSLPPGQGWDANGWGFGPDAEDRSMILAVKKDQLTSELWLVNLWTTQPHLMEVFYGGDATWKFSPCGDLLAVKKTVAPNQLTFRWWSVFTFDWFAESGVSLSGNVRDAWPAVTSQGQVLRKAMADGTTADETVGPNAAPTQCR
ncbi:MAG: hypothetical protein M3348_13960 [Acidobacteriota bacterium]|nr:hypothetical protein [Acidobacteriota bacterium]